jgi:hypothetical protein
LPSDYLQWTKIGILNNDGEVSTLKVNNGLTEFRDNNPNRLTSITPDISTATPLLTQFPFYLNYFDNGMYYNLYGFGGGLIQYGSCRIDEKNSVILLDLNFAYPHVILEYMSAPELDEDYHIQLTLQEAVIAFIEWKLKLQPRELYVAAKLEARRRLPGKKVTLSTINQVLREPNGMKLRS